MAFVLHKLRREAPRSEEQARVLLAAGGGESAALASGSSSSGALLSPRGVRPVSAPAPSPAALPSVCRFRDLTNEVFGAPSASSPVASMGSAPSAPDLSAPMAPFYSSSSQNSASGFVSSLGLPSLPFVPHAPVVSAANTGAPLSSVSTGPGHPDDDDLDDHDLLDPKPSPSGSAPSAASASSSSASAAAVPPFVEVRQAADENDEKERLWSLDQLPDLNFITRLVDERYAIGNHLSDSQAIVIQKNLIVGDLTELHHGLIQGEWSNFLKFSERALRELSPQDLSNYNNWF